MIGRELELHQAAEAAGANLPALAREFIDARARDCGDALRFSENAWWTCGPVDGGDWTPAMSAYRDALYALMQERARMAGKAVGVVLSGGNVDKDVFARVLNGG